MCTSSISLVYTVFSVICLVSDRIMCTSSISLVYTVITITCLVSGRIMCTGSIPLVYTVISKLLVEFCVLGVYPLSTL